MMIRNPRQMFRNVDDPYSRALIVDLHRAAQEDDCRVVHEILLSRVPVDAKNDQHGNATIHFATLNINHDFEVISLLIEKGADVDMLNKYDKTPLHLALERDNSNPKVIKLMLDSGADVNRVNVSNSSALHFAVQGTNCEVEVMDLLLERGAVINAVNLVGDTPLLRALRSPHCTEDIIAWFLKHGANIEVTNHFGRSVLHTVAENPNFDLGILKFLLKKNVPLDICNSFGKTPLYRTIENCCDPAIVHSLLDAGATIDYGKSTFEIAIDVCLNTWSKNSMVNLALLVRYATLRNLDCDIDRYVNTSEPRFQSLLDFNKFCRQDVLKMNLREIVPGATFREFLTGQKRLRFNASAREGELYDLGRIFHFMEVDRYPMYSSIISRKLDIHDVCDYLRIYSKNSNPESKAIFLDYHSVARIVRDLSQDDVFNSMVAFHSAEVCDECLG